MGFKGNLATLSLAEIFQTLGREKSTGVLRIQAPEGQRFVEIQNGVISIAGRSAGRIMLGDLLLSRGLLDDAALKQALQLQKESTRLLGQVLIESGIISKQQLEEALRFQIEEEVCELFTLHKGDFDFLEGSTLDARIAPAGGMVRLKLNLSDLLVEAARRAEEWKTIEQRIPSQAFLFQLSAEAAKALASGEGLSPEGQILLRLVQAHRTVESIVQKGCLGRFNTNRMLLELWDVGLISAIPLSEYLSVAREHVQAARLDEAQRVAEAVVERADPAQKEQAQVLLAEVAKARKPGSGTGSAALNVSAEAKVRSEIIRRAPANLILKKQRAVWPLVVVVLLVLGVLGGAAYWLYGRGGGTEQYTLSRKQLEETATKAQELITAGKYAEGLQLLRDFRTLDSEVRKAAKELFERRQKDVEAMLMQAITRFSTACKGGADEEKRAAADALSNLIDISVLTPHVEAQRAKARIELDAYVDSQRAAQFEQKAKDIENAADKGNDARLKADAALLAEGPPESVAVGIRADVSRLENARADAERLLQQARALRDAGDVETAKFFYGRAKQAAPGSTQAAAADKELNDVNQAVAAQQAEYEKIETLLTQNKSAEARVALTKFLDGKPSHSLVVRALAQLQALQPADEAELAAAFKAAAALYEKEPPDEAGARKKIIELAEKQPYAKSSRAATLKVEITSQPEGAAVTLNGKAVGEPLKLQVPVLGLVRLAFTKEGCRPEEVVANGFREERLSVPLNRTPSPMARMPVPARFGLALETEQLVLGGPSAATGAPPELVLCARQDLKVQRRIKLPKGRPEDDEATPRAAAPLFAICAGEAFVPGQENALLGVNLSSGVQRRIELGAPPTSSPAFFVAAAQDQGGEKGRMVGLATELGYERYLVEGGKGEKRLALPGADKPAPQGAAFDGELFFIPRGDGALYAVNAQTAIKKWSASLDAALCGPPALFPFVAPGTARQGAVTVAVATQEGRVAAFDAQSGTALWKCETKKPLAFGLASAGAGFVAAHSDGSVDLLSCEKKGAIAWTVKGLGECLLTPLVVRDQANPRGSRIAVCVKPAAKAPAAPEPCVVVMLAADTGAVQWRSALLAPAAAMMTDGERLYVSTEDAELYVFDLK